MDPRADRISCPHGEACGACALLDVRYEEHLRGKRETLARALAAHHPLRDVRPLACLPSPLRAGYRNRAKMAVGISRHGGVRVGYFRAGTREIVDAPDCRVLVPELLETTRRIRDVLRATRRLPRELRHLDLRCGSDPACQHLTLVFRATEPPAFPVDALLASCPAVTGLSINLNPSPGPQVIRGPVRPVWGEREVWVEHAGLRLRVSPASFFQVNPSLLPAIHDMLQAFFEDGDVLADLYAGVGTHGLALASRFRRVLLAEGHRPAVADLRTAIRRHGISHAQVSPVAVERGLSRLCDAAPDAVVLNPSRPGVRPEVLEALAHCPVRRLAYLSCEPRTLARDLEILCRLGFDVRRVQPLDMMPQTRQVEALALLTRPSGAGPPARVRTRSPRRRPRGRGGIRARAPA